MNCRFVCKNNGVIFENQLLQIGLKSEYRQNLGELHYRNFCLWYAWVLHIVCYSNFQVILKGLCGKAIVREIGLMITH